MNRYVKLVNIILIFVIILGLGITESFADDVNWKNVAQKWDVSDIKTFLKDYGGFPKGLSEDIRKEWRSKITMVEDKDALNLLDKDAKVSDKELKLAKDRVLDVPITDEEKYYQADLAHPSEREEILSGGKEDLSSGIAGTEDKDRNIDSTISAAKNFITSANTSGTIDEGELQKGIANIYNIFFAIGMIAVVACGSALGIRFMVSSVEGKAEVKELLVPYLVGTFIVFGAFGIWKLVMEIAKLF